MLNKFAIEDMAWSLKNFMPMINEYDKTQPHLSIPIEETPYYDAAQALAIIHEHQFGDIYPISVFINQAVEGYFTDYDGTGRWVDGQGNTIGPWSFTKMGTPEYDRMKAKGAKYIIWYNK